MEKEWTCYEKKEILMTVLEETVEKEKTKERKIEGAYDIKTEHYKITEEQIGRETIGNSNGLQDL